ncbi:helix-turn-helix transcriptional regulator [Mesonia aestuariivivens]|uniref:LuxR C-terminal-related transcriptional regulator n=1 Tax=Mesonia aestuariivivens TaxID=2796128 RepID=A0ABS6W353_9FLAO|nr:LuxR C-terminal-related transcriptional regulator [Mesonia aestuariivivens]MBW2962280.1 LuxR C-terminal-related transcriptional regulator [Mesonia aestuariivivens]
MDKSTTNNQQVQHLIAGLLQEDTRIEFFGRPETMEVQFIQNGKTHEFNQLEKKDFMLLANAFNSNKEAQKHINALQHNHQLLSFTRRVELYTYFMYGGLDDTPDIINGELQEPENYRHTLDCFSLNFKTIKLNGSPLKPRELKMLDLFAEDHKDEVVAQEMGIAISTFNQHKRAFFKKVKVQSKPALMMSAMREKAII